MEMPYQLEVLWCRTFQSVLKIGNYFMGYRMPKYLEGPGKIKELGAFLKEKGINDVLVVTGAGMVRRGQVQPMLEGFDQNGIRYTLQTYTTTDTRLTKSMAANPSSPSAVAAESTVPKASQPRLSIRRKLWHSFRVC